MHPEGNPLKGVALVVLAVLLFASADTLGKHLAMLYPVTLILAVRYTVNLGLISAVMLPRHGRALFRTQRTGRPMLARIRHCPGHAPAPVVGRINNTHAAAFGRWHSRRLNHSKTVAAFPYADHTPSLHPRVLYLPAFLHRSLKVLSHKDPQSCHRVTEKGKEKQCRSLCPLCLCGLILFAAKPQLRLV